MQKQNEFSLYDFYFTLLLIKSRGSWLKMIHTLWITEDSDRDKGMSDLQFISTLPGIAFLSFFSTNYRLSKATQMHWFNHRMMRVQCLVPVLNHPKRNTNIFTRKDGWCQTNAVAPPNVKYWLFINRGLQRVSKISVWEQKVMILFIIYFIFSFFFMCICFSLAQFCNTGLTLSSKLASIS